MISVVVPNYNGHGTLKQCLEAIRSSRYPSYECIVVDDGSTDNSLETAGVFADQIIQVKGGPLGPAHARNLGAQAARGEIVFFIDADVVVYPDTLDKVAASFTRSSPLAAVFGSYDDQPGDGHFLSQYKNLFHHFVHQQADENSKSFWSGCGAIRREIFLALGGFDTIKFPRPSIEDIDLGRRLAQKGYRIIINKSLQVKHLKRWTLLNLIKTDVFDRGIPWTQLALAEGRLPNDLNLESSQRWSALLVCALLAIMAVGVIVRWQAFPTASFWLTGTVFFLLSMFILLNRRFYTFFSQKRGVMFAVAVIPFHMLYFLYSVTAFVIGSLIYYWKVGFPFLGERAGGKS